MFRWSGENKDKSKSPEHKTFKVGSPKDIEKELSPLMQIMSASEKEEEEESDSLQFKMDDLEPEELPRATTYHRGFTGPSYLGVTYKTYCETQERIRKEKEITDKKVALIKSEWSNAEKLVHEKIVHSDQSGLAGLSIQRQKNKTW